MAAAYRSHSATTYATRTNTTITAPAGIADEDVLTLIFVRGNDGSAPATPTWPSGFALESGFPTNVSVGTYNVNCWLLTKIASSESGDYVVTHGNGASQGLIISASGGSGVVQKTVNSQNYPGSTSTITATGLTTGADNSLVIFATHNWDSYGAAAPPSGSTPTFTERLDSASGIMYFATGVMATAGATGNKTHNSTNGDSANPWVGMLIEIRAAVVSSFVPRQCLLGVG